MQTAIKSFSPDSTLLMGLNTLAPKVSTAENIERMSAHAYMRDQLTRNDVVFFGTTHERPRILALIADLMPELAQLGVTHLALEIGSDQQDRLNALKAEKIAPAEVELHAAIDCPTYRDLLTKVQNLNEKARPQLAAIDLPPSQYDNGASRDQWMAQQLAAIWKGTPNAKVLVVLGSLNVQRKLDWQDGLARQHAALRTNLEQLQPDLSMHSVVNIMAGSSKGEDFNRAQAFLNAPVALEVDKRFAAWQLGLTHCIAIKPSQPHELTDGIIIH